MRESKRIEIVNWCEENKINLINLRNMKKSGKTRIVITILCAGCKDRFDIGSDSLFRQKYPGFCTSCAHKKSAAYRKLSINEIIARFEKYGYKVLTPAKEIKPRGHFGLERTPVAIKNRYGEIFNVTCNNFMNRLDYYIDINNQNYKEEIIGQESRLECKVRQFLEEQNIPFKQEFRFMDCCGEKFPLPFDFCLFYKDKNKRILIEVDGERHYRPEFKTIQKNDKIKNFYCTSKNIPILRLPYTVFNNTEKYKQLILDFLKLHE